MFNPLKHYFMIIENSDDGNVIWSRKFCSLNDTQKDGLVPE
jgi:hypothetical protein